jgi:hypothetical protein
MNLARIVQQVFQGIAARAGDHDHAAVRPQVQQLAIEPRVLPAGVVDQSPAVHAAEHEVMGPLHQSARKARAGGGS